MVRLRDLELEDEVGQLFWIGFEGAVFGPALQRLVRLIRPGGLILFSRNIGEARQVRALTDDLFRSIGVPPFLAVDQEGGRVNRLLPILGPTPSNHWLAGLPNPSAAVRTHARAIATALRALGFSVNFAPVLDLSGPDPKNGIGDRAFADEAARVVELASVHAREHLQAGILPVGKHFPGLGSATADTHLTLPVIRRSRSLLLRHDLQPYRRLRRLLPIVMVGHAYYPALQGRRPRPATLSPVVVEGLLRKRIDHRGLILTDDLEMGALDQSLDGAGLARAALMAGSDGLMFCRTEERIVAAREGLLRAIHDREIDRARIGRSVRRILRLKSRSLSARHRGRFSAGAIARARLLLESLEGPASLGADPTARP